MYTGESIVALMCKGKIIAVILSLCETMLPEVQETLQTNSNL